MSGFPPPARAEGQTPPLAVAVAVSNSRSPPLASPPGGAALLAGKHSLPLQQAHVPQTVRTPSPQPAPVAQPMRPQQQQQQQAGAGGVLSPQSRVLSPPAGATSKSPSPAPLASSSLASFYGGNSGGGSGSSGSPPHPPSASESGPEGQQQSAASSYASLANQPTPKSAAAQHRPTHSTSSTSSSTSATLPTSPSSSLHSIASKFVNPPLDLTANPHRSLIKEGLLSRQATFKSVSRYCYLFTDLFIVTEPIGNEEGKGGKGGKGGDVSPSSASHTSHSSSSRLIMKQIVHLGSDATLQSGKKATIFILDNPEKPLYFECASEEEAAGWREALAQAIYQAKNVTPASPPKYDPVVDSHTLFTTVTHQNEELLLHLLSERGDDPNMLDEAGRTPLHHCVMVGFTAGVTLLLAHGADYTKLDPSGKSSVHLAALYDEYGILMIFLSRKPRWDTLVDQQGRTPVWDLLMGPHRVQENYAKQFRREGEEQGGEQTRSPPAMSPKATPLSKSGRKKKSGQSAYESSEPESDESDEDDGSDPHPSSSDDDLLASPRTPHTNLQRPRSLESIQRTSWRSLMECLGEMVDQGVDLEQVDRSGRSVAMHLASIQQHESLGLLLKKGASLSGIDAEGRTLLHWAVCPQPREAKEGQSEEEEDVTAEVVATVQMLLQAGLCPNLRDHSGNTPLHLCRSLAVAGCLLVHGARPDLKNEQGIKAVAYFEENVARGFDHPDTLQAIKEARDQFSSRPDTFLPPDEHLEAASWMEDEINCRRCCMLVCGACSSKRFRTRTEDGLRACDGCYNFMAHKYQQFARKQRRAKAKKRQEEQRIEKERAAVLAGFEDNHKRFLQMQADEEARIAAQLKRIEDKKAHPERDFPPPPSKTKRGSATMGGSSSSSSSSSDAQLKSLNSKTGSTHHTMNENRRMMLERGEKLSQMEDKASRMEADAENFASMAAKLKEKHKNSWF